MGKAARRVVSHLEGLGVYLEGSEYFQVEVACTMFYPNHIKGVIDKCLSGNSAVEKFFKAQDHGWYYFAKPITDMLANRESARNIHFKIHFKEGWVPDRAAKIYQVVCTSLLPHDINTAEVNQLLYDIPLLSHNKQQLLAAIHICKDRNARSIPYLHGILERQGADLHARLRERDENQVDVWEPGKATDTIGGDQAASEWAALDYAIKSMKDINESSPRHRRRS